MKVLLKAATIISPSSPFNGHSKNILIYNGVIADISDELNADDAQLIDIGGLHVSIGWTDIFSNFCDPGDEHKESLETGANAAAAGGFTDVFVVPNTGPVIQDKSQTEYIVQKSKSLPVDIYPLGAISKNCEGKELAEIYDMRNSGAIAFTDGVNSIQSAGLLVKALQYVKAFNGVVIQLPGDRSLSGNGLMNEGIMSTRLGLPGKPAIAEELMIARDIELLKYTGSKLHITGISTRRSLELILEAKSYGLNITCSVSPAHIYFNDEDLSEYDTNLKINPPLRTRADMLWLKEAVRAGKVDCIASHHMPQDWDNKVCEFEYAKSGMIALETLFSVACTAGVSLKDFVSMQERSRSIFGLSENKIEVNAKASLTLFMPEYEYTVSAKNFYSKSRNSAFIGKKLKGLPLGIINGSKVFLNNNYSNG